MSELAGSVLTKVDGWMPKIWVRRHEGERFQHYGCTWTYDHSTGKITHKCTVTNTEYEVREVGE